LGTTQEGARKTPTLAIIAGKALNASKFSHKEAQKAQTVLLIFELFVLLCGYIRLTLYELTVTH
jgi:hypothetical protein